MTRRSRILIFLPGHLSLLAFDRSAKKFARRSMVLLRNGNGKVSTPLHRGVLNDLPAERPSFSRRGDSASIPNLANVAPGPPPLSGSLPVHSDMPAGYADFANIALSCPRGHAFNISSAAIAVRLESALPFRPPLLQADPEPFQA
jgi:hypothetical protein